MKIYQIILPESIITNNSEIKLGGKEDSEIEKIDHINSIKEEELSIDKNPHKERFGFELSDSEISNFLSHREAWKKFIDTNLPWCLIIESNTNLDTSIKKISSTINKLPADWDVFFPYDYEENTQTMNGKNLLNINTWEFCKIESYLLGYKLGNSIYMLSRSGAKKLLDINTIDDRLDDTILKMTQNDPELEVYSMNVKWFDRNQIEDYNWSERLELIYEEAKNQTSWTDEKLESAKELLKIISDIGSNKNIDLILEAGTLLGYVRHGGIMFWDDDIDIGIEEKNLDIFIDEIKKHKDLRISGEFKYRGTRFFKIWNVNGEKLEKHKYTFPFIDLWVYKLDNNDLTFENNIRYPNTAKLGFEEVIFEGFKYKIPKNSLEALDSRFVDWRDTIRIYTWSHRFDKHSFKYLYIPIKTDTNGKMIQQFTNLKHL